MGHVGRHEWRGKQHLVVRVLGLRDLLPLLEGEGVAKGGGCIIRLLVVLQHERVAQLAGELERAGHCGLLILLERHTGVGGVKLSYLAALIALGPLEVHHLGDELVGILEASRHVAHASLAEPLGDLVERGLLVAVAQIRALRGKDRIHRVVVLVGLDVHVAHREHAAGEVLRRGNGALLAVCVEAHLSG